MKSRKPKNIIFVTILILVISIIFLVHNNNKIYDAKVDTNKVTLAIMVEKAKDKYVEYKSNNWPKRGYRYTYSKCVDKNDAEIGDLITFDARTDTAIMKSNKASFCTLYFAIDKELPSIVDGTFYVGKTKEQEYTNNRNEEIHITLKEDTITNTIDVIEYCLVGEKDSNKCEWKELPKLDQNNSFIVTDYDLGSDGDKTVYLYLKDGAKNISDAVEDKIILDTVAPSCKLWGESTTWINSDRTITYGCSDDGSKCKVEKIDNQTFTTTAKTGIIKNYTIEDNAGNANNCNGISANVYIDKEVPSCEISISGTNFVATYFDTGGSNVNTSASSSTTQEINCAKIYTFNVYDNANNSSSCSATVINKNKQLYTKISKTCNSNTTYDCYRQASNVYWENKNSSYCNSKCPVRCGTKTDRYGLDYYYCSYKSCSSGTLNSDGFCYKLDVSSCGSGWNSYRTHTSYSFGDEIPENNVESCTPNNISCDADHSGHTYVSCTSTGSTCSDGYTEVGNYCYKLN